MRVFLLIGVCLLLCAVVLSGCGPRSSSPVPPAQNTAADTQTGQTGTDTAQRNTLSARLPVLSSMHAGAEFDFIITASMVEELYQGSGRVLYDAGVVQPVAAQWGAYSPASGIRAAKLDAASSGGASGFDGCVPFAFTALPGQEALSAGQGEVLRVRFRLVADPGSGPPVRLLNDPAHLQLRDAQGQRLGFDFCEEVSAR